MSALVELLPPRIAKWRPNPIHIVARSAPFAVSSRGRYVHRVRSAAMHVICGKSHFSVSCWCGTWLCVGGKSSRGNTFAIDPPASKPICATCEGRAIGAGQLGSREIAGRSVMFSPRGAA